MTRLPTEEGLAPGTAGGGRQRLFKAALRLAAKSRSIHAIGVRELGRQAGLNPNTFYRHFPDIEALTLALIAEIGSDLRRTLRELRRQAAPRQELATRTVQQVFDFALNQPEAISVAVRELHGPSAAVRSALRELLDDIARDMADDLTLLKLAPALDGTVLRQLSLTVVRHLFYSCLDVLEQPRKRAAFVRQATAFINMLFAGAAAWYAPANAARRAQKIGRGERI